MDASDLEFWAFIAVALPGLLLPVAIAWRRGRAVLPVAMLSLVFWPAALILALRLKRGDPEHGLAAGPSTDAKLGNKNQPT